MCVHTCHVDYDTMSCFHLIVIVLENLLYWLGFILVMLNISQCRCKCVRMHVCVCVCVCAYVCIHVCCTLGWVHSLVAGDTVV